MKRAVMLCVLVACGGARPVPALAPRVTLVESVPVETRLDHPDLPDAASVWVDMVRSARHTIDLAEFYASNHQPSTLEPVVGALEAAIARGVRVRFLVEQGFVKTYPDTLDRLAHAGATIQPIDWKGLHGAGILHAKYFIVDDREAFLGSQNFDWRALEHNYELGARISDPAVVAGLAAIFAADWASASSAPAAQPHAPVPTTHARVQLVASPPELLPDGVAYDLPAIVALLDGARASITVQALSYLAGDWDALEAPLKRAAARGVHVQLLFADWSKRAKTIGGLQALARVPNIAVRLTTIPPWSGGFVPFARVTHAKALVVDGVRGWLGTSNWEADYFTRSRNVGLLLDDPALVRQLARFFASLWESPYAVAVDPSATYAPPRIGE